MSRLSGGIKVVSCGLLNCMQIQRRGKSAARPTAIKEAYPLRKHKTETEECGGGKDFAIDKASFWKVLSNLQPQQCQPELGALWESGDLHSHCLSYSAGCNLDGCHSMRARECTRSAEYI